MDTAQNYLGPQYSSGSREIGKTQKNWKKIIFFAVLILALYLLKTEWWDKPTLVTVMGDGRVKIQTQRGSLNIRITSLASSSAQAKIVNEQKVKVLRELVKNFGVKDTNITLDSYKVATIAGSPGKEIFEGINNAVINLPDRSKYDSLVSQLKSQNYLNITDLDSNSKISDVDQKRVLDAVVADGRAKAEKIKKQLGKVFVGRVTSINIISESNTQSEVSKTAALVFELH